MPREMIRIRQEAQEDHRPVYALHEAAFGQRDEADLVDALRKNAAAFVPELSLVATQEERIVGHILFTRVQIRDDEGRLHPSLALAPMAVSPGSQKTGIGGQLIREGCARAKELGFGSVIVLGHAHYYPRYGFRPASTWKIRAPFAVAAEAFMALELVPAALDRVSGMVVYPPEFGVF